MCLICDRIEKIKHGTNSYFVKELNTGYVVIGDHQHFEGYTLFLCKEHKTELHFLDDNFKLKFLEEMSKVAEAVYNAFKPEKLNIELLGNGDAHLHWHIFPRTENDTPIKGPVWWLPKEEMYDNKKIPAKNKLEKLVSRLKSELEKLV